MSNDFSQDAAAVERDLGVIVAVNQRAQNLRVRLDILDRLRLLLTKNEVVHLSYVLASLELEALNT